MFRRKTMVMAVETGGTDIDGFGDRDYLFIAFGIREHMYKTFEQED